MPTRREMLELMAAAGITLAAGCGRGRLEDEMDNAPDSVLGVVPISGMHWPTRDPFLFCAHHNDDYPAGNDQLGPAASLTGRQIGMDFASKDGWNMYHGRDVPGFPQHPHRGFETVTVVRRGLLDHADSLGAAARYGQGDVQWLTAGAGILHAEMFPLLDPSAPNPVELFQIWLNLPRASKMVEPHFKMLWNEAIPRQVIRDDAGRSAEVAVVAGRLGDAVPPAPPPSSWAARADADVAIWTVKLDPGAKLAIPAAGAGTGRTLYLFAGEAVTIGGRLVPGSHAVELRPDVDTFLENGAERAELLMLQGRPIGEPVVQHGPFVMNTQGEIRQAMVDYQRTQFGGWPWGRDDPVHPRDEGRFARHIDGRLERPA
jgi:quercetin 2,3-dioxygenase